MMMGQEKAAVEKKNSLNYNLGSISEEGIYSHPENEIM